MRAAIAHRACARSPPQCCVFASLRRPGGPCAAAPRQTRRARRARRAAETRTSARAQRTTLRVHPGGDVGVTTRRAVPPPARSKQQRPPPSKEGGGARRAGRPLSRETLAGDCPCLFLHSHFSCSAHVSLSLSSEPRSYTPPLPRVPHGSAAAPRTRGRPSAAASGSVAALNSSRRAPPNVPLYTGACALPVVRQCCTYHVPPLSPSRNRCSSGNSPLG